MFENKIVLSPQDILEKEFKIDTRGYRLKEVDQFLDMVINDYEEFFKIINALEQEKFMLAAFYFEQGLRIDPEHYACASGAAMSYLGAGSFDHAIEMLKKCISIKPEAPEPYIYLSKLYPDKEAMPDEIIKLLQFGYTLTHDTKLAQFAQSFD